MAIESICSGCGRQLRVDDAHAGKKARCPACKTVYQVPGQRLQAPATPTDSASSSAGTGSSHSNRSSSEVANTIQQPAGSSSGGEVADVKVPVAPQRNSQSPQWMFRSENGHLYGPVSRDELNRWAAEGRVSRDCHLQLVGGDGRWEPAMGWIDPNAIRALANQNSQMQYGNSQYGNSNHSQADYSPASYGQVGASQSVVHAAPQPGYGYAYQTETGRGGYQRQMTAHRGGIILLYGLLGVGCPIFSVMAWLIGYGDLGRMNRGEMDPGGRVSTQAGMLLGILMASIQAMLFILAILSF